MFNPLDPTIDDVKLHTTLLVDGYTDIVDAELAKMPTPALRQYARLAINLLATVKANELQNRDA